MLTPAFELFQDERFLTIVIKAPFTKISETEIFIEDCDFKFYSKPYFLRLNLPGKIVEDGREEANYDAEKGTFTIKVPKKTEGEEFEGLDMLTRLLAPKGLKSAHQPVIEVLGEKSMLPSEALPEEEDVDWSVEQTVYTETESLSNSHKYGFACQRSGVFTRLQAELCEVVDVKDPDSLSPEERRSLRKEQEGASFSDDHYLADLYQDEMVQEILKFQAPWCQAWIQLQKGDKRKDIVVFTEEEKEKMRKLPNKEYLIDSAQVSGVYLNLVDIIFAYAYSLRLTEGEHNVESGWTVTKLSATLSWLEMFPSLRDVLVTCYRRCLSFPLYRHWSLLEKAKEDTYRILSLGRRQVLKCLLDIQTVLTDTDQRYVLNDLYINDYCVWIQGVSNSKLENLANAVQKIQIQKGDLDLSLVELEEAAELAVEEEEAGGIVGKLERLAVSGTESGDSDDDSTEQEDSSDDEYTESDDQCSKSDDDCSKSDIIVKSGNAGSDVDTNADVCTRSDDVSTCTDVCTRSDDVSTGPGTDVCTRSGDVSLSYDVDSGDVVRSTGSKLSSESMATLDKGNLSEKSEKTVKSESNFSLESGQTDKLPDLKKLQICETTGK